MTKSAKLYVQYIESSVLHCRCPSIQCYCYDASEKENSTRKDRRWAQPEWGDMTKCGPVTYCTRHGSLSDPQARRLASSPTPHFFSVQTPHCTIHTISTSREKTISTQPHSSWWCVCVLYNWCVMLKWDQAQVSQRGNCFTTWIRASVEWGSRGKLDLWGSHSVSSTSFVSCQTNVLPHQHKVFALSILYRGCIVHLNLVYNL